jgi:hypothetical protein
MHSHVPLSVLGEERIPLTQKAQTRISEEDMNSLGLPKTKPIFSWTDAVTLAVSLACVTLAVATIFLPALAKYNFDTSSTS